MSNNLNLAQVTAGQTSKEVTINQQAGEIDAAITEVLISDYVAGNITLTDIQYRQNLTFETLNLSVARVLNVSQIKKESIIDNTAGSNTLTVTRGSGTVAVAAGATAKVYTDGTANGIIQVGAAVGAVAFTDLTDTPANYTDNSGMELEIDEAGSQLIFVGKPWKKPVRLAVDTNVVIASALESGDSLDGLTLAEFDRVLLMGQSTGAENGIYVVVGVAAGAAGRSIDLDDDADAVLGFMVAVLEGDSFGGSTQQLTNTSAVTVGSTTMTFAQPTIRAATKNLWIPAEVMIASTATPVLATAALTAGQPQIRAFDFDATTDEAVQYAMVMPEDWDLGVIQATFMWSHAAAVTFDVVWRVAAVSVANDGAIDVAFGTQISVTDSGGTTDDQYIITTADVTVGGTIANGNMVYFEFERNGLDGGTDTLDVDARLQGVRITYTTI